MQVVLASASPRRRELLAALLPGFDVVHPAVPEELTGDPVADCERLAAAKATAVAATLPRDTIVVGADTIVFRHGRSYGKPADAAAAVRMLHELRGAPHEVVTGLSVLGPGFSSTGHSRARVTLAALPDAAIAAYVASGRPLDKAGAYAIQDDDVPTGSALEGCYCCVVGLPLWRLHGALASAGLPANRPDATFARCAACPERPR